MRIASLLFVAFLILAGCGGGDDDTPTADDVIAAFDEAGLPVGRTTVFTEDTDPNERLGRPGQYTSKVNFHDERLEIEVNDDFQVSGDSGGAVEVFDSEGDAEEWLEFVESVNTIGRTYNYREGKIVMRLSFSLTPEQAEEYAAVLDDL